MFIAIMFFVILIIVCFEIDKEKNISKNAGLELESPTCAISVNDRDFVLLQSTTNQREVEVESVTETTTEFVFKPYTYWYDYNRHTGEIIKIDEMPIDENLQRYIYDLCEKYHISFALIMAQIGAETDFDANACSEVNAVGLMQIRAKIHSELIEELGVSDISNPYENVLVGITLMYRLFAEHEEPNLALMAYNSGASGARRLWQQGIYSTTYTSEILAVSKAYEDAFGY